jgi:hypothetical protein
VITWHDGNVTTESWLRITPGLLEQLDVRAEEERVVRETAAFLVQRQEAADMPAVIELEDVAASYEDYLAQLVRRSRSPEEAQG